MTTVPNSRYCDLCRENHGFKRVRRRNADGSEYEALAPCDHGQSKRGFERADVILIRASAEKDPGISPEMKKILRSAQNDRLTAAEAALTPADRKIAALIQARVGKANAIRGRDLALDVWPEEMKDDRYESAVRRWLEESISRLRRFARLPIAASKTNPMGYYIPSTAEECDEVHDRLFREGIERIKDSQLFRPDRDLVERLRGQLELVTSDK